MRKRTGFVFLLFGLVLAGLVGVAVFRLARDAQAKQVDMVDVLVVSQNVPERTLLTPAMVTVIKTLPDARPADAFTHPSQVEGRMTVAPLYAGDLVLPEKLAETNGHSGLTYTLQPGEVAITFPASDIITTGALRVGDRVDLLITVSPEAESDTDTETNTDPMPPTTQTAMQNLRILGIGSVAGPANTGLSLDQAERGVLLTFAVSHQDALVLKALKDSAVVKYEVVLRAAGDDQVVDTDPVTLDRIIELYGLR